MHINNSSWRKKVRNTWQSTHIKLCMRISVLTFGIATAPSIFQAVMDQIIQGMANVVCYLDDILIASRTEEEHLAALDEVLFRLEKYGVVVNQSKWEFRTFSVEYLGHRIDEDGLHPLKDKIAVIVDVPSPTNVSESRAYLALINYYVKFMSNRATMLKPLHNLLRASEKWVLSEECESVFQESKTELLTNRVLVHYDSNRALKLDCDASQYGVGAVLSHVMDNGEERPIAFVSRSLTKSETNYAQLEKEALAMIFGVKKFHKYLYGRSFTLVTDHRPLVTILGPTKAVPPIVAARMQRWALILQAYSYDVEYHQGVSIVMQMRCLACHANRQIAQKMKSASCRVYRNCWSLRPTSAKTPGENQC